MRKNKKTAGYTSTFLGKDVNIEGTFTFEDTIRIEGKIKGHIKSENGVLIVGEGALIDAEMDVGSAIIMGDVNGKITARKKIEIFSPGRFTGKILVPVLSMEKGVIFNGKCIMERLTESVIKTADFNELKK